MILNNLMSVPPTSMHYVRFAAIHGREMLLGQILEIEILRDLSFEVL